MTGFHLAPDEDEVAEIAALPLPVGWKLDRFGRSHGGGKRLPWSRMGSARANAELIDAAGVLSLRAHDLVDHGGVEIDF